MATDENKITLPRTNADVSIRLTAAAGTLPDVPFVIFLYPPGSNKGTKIGPPGGHCSLETQYSLGKAANALVDSATMCAGGVLFPQADTVTLQCEFFVNGKKLKNSATTQIKGNAGDAPPFHLTCRFV